MTELTGNRCRCCRVMFGLAAECLIVVAVIFHMLITTTQLLVHYEIIAPREKNAGSTGGEVTTAVTPMVNDTGQDSCDPPPEHDVVAVVVVVLRYVTLIISALFLVEIISKMMYLRKKFFKDLWMLFDTSVVLASVTIEVLLFIGIFCYNSGVGAAAFVIVLRLWRIHRACSIRKKKYRERLDDEIRYLTQTKMETELKYKHMEQTCRKHQAELQRLSNLLEVNTEDVSEKKQIANGTTLAAKLTAQFHAGNNSVELGPGNRTSRDGACADDSPTLNRSASFTQTNNESKENESITNEKDTKGGNELERNDSDVNSKAADSGIEVKDSFRSDKAQVKSRVKGYSEDNVFDDSDSEAPPGGETSVQEVRVQIEDTIHQRQLPSISRSVNEEEPEHSNVTLRRKASSSAALGVENAAYVCDADELDGMKTYRSIDGTPMTDL